MGAAWATLAAEATTATGLLAMVGLALAAPRAEASARRPPWPRRTASAMGRRLRIAVVAACPFPARRGTPVRVQRLSEALAARGHRVVVFTYPLGDGSPVGPVEVPRRRLPGYRFLGPGPTAGKLLGLDWLLAHEVRRGLRRERFDLVHAHHYEGLIVALLARPAGLPLAYDAHTLLETELPSYPLPACRAGARRRVGRELDRRLPSPRRLRRGRVAADRRPARRGRPSRAGTGLRRDQRRRGCFLRRAAAGDRPCCGERRPASCSPSNLGPYQGIDHLVDSFAMVAADPQCPAAAHHQRRRAAAGSRLAQLGLADRVEVTPGNLEELPRGLARADVAVNPRPAGGGVPQKLLNYMATGLPIVSFAGTAFELRHEVTGLVVPTAIPPRWRRRSCAASATRRSPRASAPRRAAGTAVLLLGRQRGGCWRKRLRSTSPAPAADAPKGLSGSRPSLTAFAAPLAH